MGVGIVGGRLLPDRSLGVKAAGVAARILHGEAPSSIQSPPLEAGPPTFDWRELQHWYIAEDRLPAGSLVLFRPPSFWRLYRWYILGVLAIVSLQTALITGMLLQRLRRNRAVRQFEQSERRLHTIADSLPVLIAYVDRDQRYVFNNRAYDTQFGVDPESMRGRTIREVLGNELYEVARPYVERVFRRRIRSPSSPSRPCQGANGVPSKQYTSLTRTSEALSGDSSPWWSTSRTASMPSKKPDKSGTNWPTRGGSPRWARWPRRWHMSSTSHSLRS